MATPKTPVSILNEYMFRSQEVPHYELVRSVTGPDPVFEYEVVVDKIKVSGCARNKKDAKHMAARNALTELAKTDDLIRRQLLANYGIPTSQAANINADSAISMLTDPRITEQVTENAVGALTALCAQHNLPPPDYKIVEESGPAHCRNFVMHCIVKTRNLQLVGMGQAGTKKQAKQISAKRLIEKINELIEEPSCNVKEIDLANNSPSHTVDTNLAKKLYNSIKKKEGVKCRENNNLIISTCHLNLQNLEGTEATALRNKQIGNPEDTLLRFAEEQKLTYAVQFTKAVRGKEEDYLCVATLDTVPELCQFGIGPTESSAREVAACNLLKCLITLLV